ncbi:hypothetical protein BASA50_002311 [Batrachochytrium salamandrivorans]|uniref:BRCT domain-containing protein n=1 Tax=Batrachochytrium salamandrivorans TaxID=1357716 RepID=A0ABQ8FLM6_9FUNG|nr:hypothetical protein BASA50_002311 [Batrachochytrium salamandrivorans]
MSIFMNSYALQLQQYHQLALAGPVLWVLETSPSQISCDGISKSVVTAEQWVLQCHSQSDFFGNVQAYPYLSDSERRRIALEQGMIINIPITSKEDQDILPEMIRVPISDSDVSNLDVCEDLAEFSLIHVNDIADNTVDDTIDELLSPKVAHEDPESPLQIDVCFASAAEIESQSFVHTAAPKRSRSNKEQTPLAPKHKSAIKIAPSTSTKQVTIRHAWEADLPTTPKKERFHVKPKKPQTHSVTQASGRQNISGDVRNHPDLISTVKKNRHNTNRDGQPKIGPIKQR